MENTRRVITFIPGSFKPFCEHHNQMTDYYSNKSDKVLIIISNPSKSENQRITSQGNVITAEEAKRIVDLTIKDSNYNNVTSTIAEENPIKTMLKYMNFLSDCDFIIGVSKKDNDIDNYRAIVDRFVSNSNCRILPLDENAFEVVKNEAEVMSAQDFRNNMTKKDYYRTHLSHKLSDDSRRKIMAMLIKEDYDSSIFEKLLNKENETDNENLIDEELDITESIKIDLNDQKIKEAKCSMVAYNLHVDENDEDEAYNPKKNPDKAVDIFFEFPNENLKIEIFLDTESKEWDSWINDKMGKLSPEQMEGFFKTNFYKKLYNTLNEVWPISDELFCDLINAINTKKYRIDGWNTNDGDCIEEDADSEEAREKRNQRKMDKIDRHERSASGRKYITPSNFAVKHDENEAYFCWPESQGKAKSPEFKWSQWADWKKIKPLARMRFAMGTADAHVYGITISPLETADKNRGFRSYDITAQPPLQYLSPQETQMLLDLDIVQKFLRNAVKRINKYLKISDQEIFERVNKPDKCTIDDIRKTKHCIKNALDAIKNGRADTYIYN